MKKKSLCMVMLFLIVLLVAAGALLLSGRKDTNWRSEWSWTVSKENGVLDNPGANGQFTVSKAGEYTLRFTWGTGDKDEVTEKEIGFVSGCILSDESGKMLYSTSGLSGKVKVTLDLPEGNYHLDYYYLATKEEFRQFAEEWLCGKRMTEEVTGQYRFDELAKEGSWKMDFTLKADLEGVTGGSGLWIVWGLILGIAIGVVVLVAVIRGNQVARPQYDERQELEQGRGMRYAFFSMMSALALVYLLDMMNILPAGQNDIFYISTLFVGIMVYVTFCIWHDCYFALNQKRTMILILFAVIGVVNLALGIGNIVSGRIVEDGHITVHVLNLYCAAMFIYLFLMLLLKKFVENGIVEDRSDPGEEE